MSAGVSPSIFGSGAPDYDALVFGNGGAQTGFFFLKLATGIYFDNIRLENAEPFWEDRSPILNATELISGEVSIQSSPATFNRPIASTFHCYTTRHSDIAILRTRMGAPYTLLIDEYTYENCYISSFKEKEWFSGEFEFIIGFRQETA